MCNKIPYKTKEEAMTDARLQRAASKHFSKRTKPQKAGRKMRTYYCRYCFNWHLTTQKIRNKRGARI